MEIKGANRDHLEAFSLFSVVFHSQNRPIKLIGDSKLACKGLETSLGCIPDIQAPVYVSNSACDSPIASREARLAACERAEPSAEANVGAQPGHGHVDGLREGSSAFALETVAEGENPRWGWSFPAHRMNSSFITFLSHFKLI